MKTKRLDPTLVECSEQHPMEFWQHYRWQDGKPVCPYCHSNDKQYNCSDGRYKCGHCKKRYSAFVGTVFQNTKLDIKKIVKGILFLFVMQSVSAVELSSYLNVNYDTAYLFLKRLQMAAKQDMKLSCEVAIDEVYMGGKWKNKHYRRKRDILSTNGIISSSRTHFTPAEAALGMDICKRPVYGGNDRKHIFLEQMSYRFDRKDVARIFGQHTENVSVCVSDDSSLYKDWISPLEVNNHSKKQYATENGLSSNRIEGVFSHLRTWFRSAHGHCKEKYLQLYLNWFVFKWNHRELSFRDMFGALMGYITRGVCRYRDVRQYDALSMYREREQRLRLDMQRQLKVLKEILHAKLAKAALWHNQWYTLDVHNNLVPTHG